jgi:hypothetical protein
VERDARSGGIAVRNGAGQPQTEPALDERHTGGRGPSNSDSATGAGLTRSAAEREHNTQQGDRCNAMHQHGLDGGGAFVPGVGGDDGGA